jgi:periplasmic nitrate reductase NapD
LQGRRSGYHELTVCTRLQARGIWRSACPKSEGTNPMLEEVHISSLVVHARPADARAVSDAIGQLPGAEIHALTEEGRMVVTLETVGEADFLTRMEQIGRLSGVVSTALVFHQVEMSSVSGGNMPWR